MTRHAENTLLHVIQRFCEQHHFAGDAPILLAVSGGADSLALMACMADLSRTYPLRLHVATLDHGLRGSEGAADAGFVAAQAQTLDLPCTVGRADVLTLAQSWSLGIEAAARRARYGFLAKTALEIGAQAIATGHTADDQAETILLHIVRGSGLAGLRGMPPITLLKTLALPDLPPEADRLLLMRPLLSVTRTAIDAYLTDRHLVPRQDSTNQETAYRRNYVRHQVMPLLEAINPNIRETLARMADLVQEDYDALHSLLPRIEDRGGNVHLTRHEFLSLHPALQRHWLRAAAMAIRPGVEIGLDAIRDAVTLAKMLPDRRGAGLDMGGGLRLRVTPKLILVYGSAFPTWSPWIAAGQSVQLTIPGSVTLPGGLWKLTATRVDPSDSADSSLDPLSIRIRAYTGMAITVRGPQHGDRFRPAGMDGHSQKLSDTLINTQIPAEWRPNIPLIAINDQIIWFIAPTPEQVISRQAHCDNRADPLLESQGETFHLQFESKEISS